MDTGGFWNNIALELNIRDHSGGGEQTGPTQSSMALALIHLAMHDAYFAIKTPNFNSFTAKAPPAGADAKIAAGAAAVTMAKNLFRKYDAYLEAQFSTAHPQITPTDISFKFGKEIADELIELRRNAGPMPVTPYDPRTRNQKQAHRTDPVNLMQTGYLGDNWGTVAVLATTHCHSLNPYPAVGGPAYTASLAEVHAMGGDINSNATSRTNDQTIAGIYWAYDGVKDLGTPPRLYNQVARKVLKLDTASPVLTADQNMRVLTMINVAMGDAGIFAWAEKYKHALWRPVLGIREADASAGPLAPAGAGTAGMDITWRPLGAPRSNGTSNGMFRNFTPDFPAYPSGHATFGAAAFQTLRLFLKNAQGLKFEDRKTDSIAFDFVSDELDGKTTDERGDVRPRIVRQFKSLWDAILENGRSRIYLGVHWNFDAYDTANGPEKGYSEKIGGIPLGLLIAEDIFGSGMKLQNKRLPDLPKPVAVAASGKPRRNV